LNAITGVAELIPVYSFTKAVVLKRFVAPDPFHCTRNLRTPSFRQRFSIIEKSHLVAFQREHLNRLGKKQISGFGLC